MNLLLASIPLGASIGLSVGLLGGGGSILAVPVLVYLLHQDVETATTVSLVVVTAAAIAGGLTHALAGCVCWRHAAAFTLAALPGIVVGTALGERVAATTLIAGFGVVMLAAAAATWLRASAPVPGDEQPGGARPAPGARRHLAAGLGVGVLTGLFGIGGGFVIVPTLAIALSFSMRDAIGTSLAIMSTTSLAALAIHLGAGRSIETDLVLVMGAACMAGALAGARLGARLPHRTLGRSFAGLVVAVAGYLLINAAFLGGPPGA